MRDPILLGEFDIFEQGDGVGLVLGASAIRDFYAEGNNLVGLVGAPHGGFDGLGVELLEVLEGSLHVIGLLPTKIALGVVGVDAAGATQYARGCPGGLNAGATGAGVDADFGGE